MNNFIFAYFYNSVGNFSYLCHTINKFVKDVNCSLYSAVSCAVGNWRDGPMDKREGLDFSSYPCKNDECVQGSKVMSAHCSFRGFS